MYSLPPSISLLILDSFGEDEARNGTPFSLPIIHRAINSPTSRHAAPHGCSDLRDTTTVPMLCQLQEARYSPVPALAEPLSIQNLFDPSAFYCPSHAECLTSAAGVPNATATSDLPPDQIPS